MQQTVPRGRKHGLIYSGRSMRWITRRSLDMLSTENLLAQFKLRCYYHLYLRYYHSFRLQTNRSYLLWGFRNPVPFSMFHTLESILLSWQHSSDHLSSSRGILYSSPNLASALKRNCCSRSLFCLANASLWVFSIAIASLASTRAAFLIVLVTLSDSDAGREGEHDGFFLPVPIITFFAPPAADDLMTSITALDSCHQSQTTSRLSTITNDSHSRTQKTGREALCHII